MYSKCKISLEDFRKEALVKYQLGFGSTTVTARSFSAADLLTMDFPDSPFQLENVFRSGELIIIAGNRKTNKSLISLDILTSLACGGQLSERIFAQQQWEVALIDAELSLKNIRDRLNRFVELYGGSGLWANNMTIVSLKQEGKRIDILREADRRWLETQIGTAKVVVFDNFGKIIKHGSESSVTNWRSIEAWFSSLQQKGVTVILVHHENKAGQVRGTQKMEDDADLIVTLKRPEKWTPADGNIVEVQFPASRHLHGDQVRPFAVEYSEDERGFHRKVRMLDVGELSSEGEKKSLIPSEVCEAQGLSPLQLDMLKIARTQGQVKAADVISDGTIGRSASSVSTAFKDLCDKEMLKAQGRGKGRYYTPFSD